MFLPKIQFWKVGLPEGVGVGESINRESMHRAVNRRTQSFVMNSTVGSRTALARSRNSRGSGHSIVSEGTSSDKATDDEEVKSNNTRNSRPKTSLSYVHRGVTPRSSGRSNVSSTPRNSGRSNVSSVSENALTNESLAGTRFKSSVAENLSSIMEVSGELDLSASLRSSGKGNAACGSSNGKTKSESSSGPELISDVRARVREKLAKRLKQSESKIPERAPPLFDMNTDLAVGAAGPMFSDAPLSPTSSDYEFQSGEFESEAGRDRLMSRLGAARDDYN